MHFKALDSIKAGTSQGYDVQIQENVGCSIIFASQKDSTITSRFLALVQKHTKQKIGKKEPATIHIEGQNFMVIHERKNAEMFILLKAD